MAPRIEAYFPPGDKSEIQAIVAQLPEVTLIRPVHELDVSKVAAYILQMDAIWKKLEKGTQRLYGQEVPLGERKRARLEWTFNVLRFHLSEGPHHPISGKLVANNPNKH